MTELVSPTEIERKVGHLRERNQHLGRRRSDDDTFYILHSQDCLDTGRDLRECPFSEALDNSVLHDPDRLTRFEYDVTYVLGWDWRLARRILLSYGRVS